MKNITYAQLEKRLRDHGANLADVAIGRMMIIVEEETGVFPDWNDTAPEWVIKNCLNIQ